MSVGSITRRMKAAPWPGPWGRLRLLTGFTLIELVIVVTLISVLALVGAINVLRSRITGNEAVTLANLRQLAVALHAHHAVNNTYPDPLGRLSDATPPYVPSSLTGGSGANGGANLVGYSYTYDQEGDFDYTLIARPATQGVSGMRRFFVDETGVLRYTVDGTDPPADSPVLQ